MLYCHQSLGFAKSRADAVVKRKAPDELSAHLEQRKAAKSMSSVLAPLFADASDRD